MTDTSLQGAHGGPVAVGHGATAPTNTGVSNAKLGMWLFLGSECLLFGGLISTYLLYSFVTLLLLLALVL